jgi:hypothetical protein
MCDPRSSRTSIVECSKDLPDFKRIHTQLNQTLDRLVRERLSITGASLSSGRSSGQKIVTFEDQSRRTGRPMTIGKTPAKLPSNGEHKQVRTTGDRQVNNGSLKNSATDDVDDDDDDDDDQNNSTTSARLQPSGPNGVQALVNTPIKPSTFPSTVITRPVHSTIDDDDQYDRYEEQDDRRQ